MLLLGSEVKCEYLPVVWICLSDDAGDEFDKYYFHYPYHFIIIINIMSGVQCSLI